MPTYRATRSPVHIGQLRCRSWRAIFSAVVAGDDPLWTERAKEYWMLQERLYGWRMSPFTILFDHEACVVSTYAVIMDILPGERVDPVLVPASRELLSR